MDGQIVFKNVNKCFKIYKNKTHSVKEKVIDKILNRNKLETIHHQVLKDVSFTIKTGETIGIIGENGTGKSTTLKIISKILRQDSGEVIVNGKVSALLEIGAGFQPDLTGRENVYLYGSILGMSKEEIDGCYDDIVIFSELETFMDTAVKNYSSGMYMRLAFAVAIHVNPDILVIDEVLAVGDVNFQKKCISKVLDFKKQGKTIVFVSHDMGTIKKICDRVFFIKKGGEMIEGTPQQMVGMYLKGIYYNKPSMIEEAYEKEKVINIHELVEQDEPNRFGTRELEVTNVYFSTIEGYITNQFEVGRSFKINIELKTNRKVDNAIIGIGIYDSQGNHLAGQNSKHDGCVLRDIKQHNHITLIVNDPPLNPGKYLLTISVYDEECIKEYDFRDKRFWFEVKIDENDYLGIVRLDTNWEI